MSAASSEEEGFESADEGGEKALSTESHDQQQSAARSKIDEERVARAAQDGSEKGQGEKMSQEVESKPNMQAIGSDAKNDVPVAEKDGRIPEGRSIEKTAEAPESATITSSERKPPESEEEKESKIHGALDRLAGAVNVMASLRKHVVEKKEKLPKREEPESESDVKIHQALDKLADSSEAKKDEPPPPEAEGGGGGRHGWGWGNWGTSILSSASHTLSNVSSSVGHGISSVIEKAETSLGVPNPQELSQEDAEVEKKVETAEEATEEKTGEDSPLKEEEETLPAEPTAEKPVDKPSSPSGVKSFFSASTSAISSVVGKTVSGLEMIGKKTMDVVSMNDPGLKNKREFLSKATEGSKPNLSQVLREAKEEAEMLSQHKAEEEERKKAHFGILFDEFQGLAHLEALEMLSNQSESKVQGVLSTLSGEDLESVKTELVEIKNAFQLEDIEDYQEQGSNEEFVNIITEHLFNLCIGATPDKLKKVQSEAHQWIDHCKIEQEQGSGEQKSPKELHQAAIRTMAELTARSIEQFHKSAELTLLSQGSDQEKSPIERTTSLSKLTTALCGEISVLSTKFSECLTVAAENSEDSESVSPLITNVYLEASNSASYIEDAFQLLLPVLQLVALHRNQKKPIE